MLSKADTDITMDLASVINQLKEKILIPGYSQTNPELNQDQSKLIEKFIASKEKVLLIVTDLEATVNSYLKSAIPKYWVQSTPSIILPLYLDLTKLGDPFTNLLEHGLSSYGLTPNQQDVLFKSKPAFILILTNYAQLEQAKLTNLYLSNHLYRHNIKKMVMTCATNYIIGQPNNYRLSFIPFINKQPLLSAFREIRIAKQVVKIDTRALDQDIKPVDEKYWESILTAKVNAILRDPSRKGMKNPPSIEELSRHPLNQRNFVTNAAEINACADIIKQHSSNNGRSDEFSYKQLLFIFLRYSKQHSQLEVGASNAITILNRARVSFSAFDLSYVRIPEADLSGAVCHFTNFEGANLKEVKFFRAYLKNANLSNSNMTNVYFGAKNYLTQKETASFSAICLTKHYLAVGYNNGNIDLLDPQTLKNEQTLRGHSRNVSKLRYNSVKNWLVSVSYEQQICIWDMTNGRLIYTCEQEPYISCAEWSPDGRYLAAGDGQGRVFLWDTTTFTSSSKLSATNQKYTLRKHTSGITSLQFSPDGKWLISADLSCALVWEVGQGKLAYVLATSGMNAKNLQALAFAHDGQYLAAIDWNTAIYLWNFSALPDKNDMAINNPLPSRTYTTLELVLWNTPRIEAANVLEAQASKRANTQVNISFSQQGNYLLSTGDNIVIWDVLTGKELGASSTAILDAQFIYKDEQIITVNPSAIQIEDTISILGMKGAADTSGPIQFSYDGGLVAQGGHNIRIWEAHTGNEVRRLPPPPSFVESLCLSPNNQYIVIGYSAAEQAKLELWDICSGKREKVLLSINNLRTQSKFFFGAICFSADGKCLAAIIGESKVIHMWDAQQQWAYFKLSQNSIDVSISAPSSSKLGEERAISYGQQPNNPFELNSKAIHESTYAFNLQTELLSASAAQILEQPPKQPPTLQFSPDGQYIISVSDYHVSLWNIVEGQLAQVIYSEDENVRTSQPISQYVFSPDGHYLILVIKSQISNETFLERWELRAPFQHQRVRQPKRDWTLPPNEASHMGGASGLKEDLTATISQQYESWQGVKPDLILWGLGEDGITGYGYNRTQQVLVTSSRDHSIKYWELKNDIWMLRWMISPSHLVVEGCKISNSKGLSLNNKKLLEEYKISVEGLTTAEHQSEGSNASNRYEVEEKANLHRKGSAVPKDKLEKVLKLTENFEVASSVDNEDCFFDALAQALNVIKKPMTLYTIKSLRSACHQYYVSHKELVDKWNVDYYGSIDQADEYYFVQYTKEELDRHFNARLPIRGRQEIEGVILCNQLDLEAIYIVNFRRLRGKSVVTAFKITDKGMDQIKEEDIPHNFSEVPVLISRELHIVPILPKLTSNGLNTEPYGQTLFNNHDIPQENALPKNESHIDTKGYLSPDLLRDAAEVGDASRIELLLQAGAGLDLADNNYRSPLTSAILNGHIEVTRLLLRTAQDQMDQLQAIEAFRTIFRSISYKTDHIQKRIYNLVKLFFDEKIDKKLTAATWKKVILQPLIQYGLRKCIRLILTNIQANSEYFPTTHEVIDYLFSNETDYEGFRGCISSGPPLNTEKVEACRLQILIFLLDKGLPINSSKEDEKTIGCYHGRCKVDNINKISGTTLLHAAAQKGYAQIVNLLLERGADTSLIRCFDQLTACEIAVANEHQLVVDSFCQNKDRSFNEEQVLNIINLLHSRDTVASTEIFASLIIAKLDCVLSRSNWDALFIKFLLAGKVKEIRLLLENNKERITELSAIGQRLIDFLYSKYFMPLEKIAANKESCRKALLRELGSYNIKGVDRGAHSDMELLTNTLEVPKFIAPISLIEQAERLNQLATEYLVKGEVREAIDSYAQALSIKQAMKTQLQAEFIPDIQQIINLCYSIQDWKRALDYQLEELAIGLTSEHNLPLETIYSRLSNTYKQINNYSQAKEYSLKALDIYYKQYSNFPSDKNKADDLIHCYQNIGYICTLLNEQYEAIEYNCKALEIKCQRSGSIEYVRDREEDLAISCNNIGEMYLSLNDSQKAIEYFNRGLEIQRNALNDEQVEPWSVMHTVRVQLINNLIRAYELVQDFEQVIYYSKQLLPLFTLLMPDPYHQAAATHETIALRYSLRGLYNEAIEHYQQALELRKSRQAPDYESKLLQLANFCNATGKNLEAASCYRQLAIIKQQSQGENSLEVADILSQQAGNLSLAGQVIEGIALYKRCLAIHYSLSSANIVLAGVYLALADAYNDVKKYKKANAYYKKSFDLGNLTAELMLGYFNEKGLIGEINYDNALQHYISSMRDIQNKAYACYRVAIMYRYGRGVPLDSIMATFYLKQSEIFYKMRSQFNCQDSIAFYRRAMILKNSYEVEQDSIPAIQLLLQAKKHASFILLPKIEKHLALLNYEKLAPITPLQIASLVKIEIDQDFTNVNITKRHSLFLPLSRKSNSAKQILNKWLHDCSLIALKAVGGDSFFDACAQALNALSNESEYDRKSLRLLCYEGVLKLDDLWRETGAKNSVASKISLDCRHSERSFDDEYNYYIANIQYTPEERKKLVVQGRPHIDGCIISEELGIKIHILNIEQQDTSSILLKHQWIEGQNSTIVDESSINYADPFLIHLAFYKGHYVPLLNRKVITLEQVEARIRKIIGPSLQAAYEQSAPLKNDNKTLDATRFVKAITKFYVQSYANFWHNPVESTPEDPSLLATMQFKS